MTVESSGEMGDFKHEVPNMDDYDISKLTGFMIENPLETLPDYFQIWNYLGTDMADLVAQRVLREKVDMMPLLDIEKLEGLGEQRLAFMLLSFIGNGYIWQDGDGNMAKVVPRQLSIPWTSLAKLLGLPTCLCHACCMLSNCTKIDPNGELCLANMKTICDLPGGEQSEWFFLVTAMVELAGLPALQSLERIMGAIIKQDTQSIIDDLRVVKISINNSRDVFKRMKEKLDPEVFYNKMRPFLSGWGGTSTPQVEDGIIFEGVHENKPQTVIGASAAQSCYVQCLDAGLGIVHEPERQRFLALMRDYMVPAHADYIRALWNGPSVRKYVADRECDDLTAAYNACVEAVAEFRSFHIQMVTRYIVVPSAKASRNADYESVAQRGTGGQDLIPFLKNIRGTTTDHSIKK